MIILKIDATLKSFLAMQFFNYCLNQTISLATFFARKQFHQMTEKKLNGEKKLMETGILLIKMDIAHFTLANLEIVTV